MKGKNSNWTRESNKLNDFFFNIFNDFLQFELIWFLFVPLLLQFAIFDSNFNTEQLASFQNPIYIKLPHRQIGISVEIVSIVACTSVVSQMEIEKKDNRPELSENDLSGSESKDKENFRKKSLFTTSNKVSYDDSHLVQALTLFLLSSCRSTSQLHHLCRHWSTKHIQLSK